MAEDSERAWREVGERFSSWGQRVASHYQKGGDPDPGFEEAEREVQRVAKEVVDQLSKGFSAVGGTLRDSEANADLGAAFTALGDAITSTVSEASRAVRSGRSGGAPSSAEATDDDEDPTGPQ